MISIRKILIISYSLILLPFIGYAAPTEVVATVDKNPITVEESFQLQVVANDDVAADAFDTSALLKDFVVGRTSVSRQTQIINFDTSKSTRWTTTLIPRSAGQFVIPSLNVAGLTTDPIQLNVLPVSASKNAQGRELFITTEVDLNEVYLQQQIRYTVKLHLSMDLQRGSLSAPEVTDADIEQVGNDKEYSEIIDGKRYRIIERTFSIIPNKSGEFTIRGPYFEGEVIDASRQSFGFFNRTKNVNRVGKNIDITVLPMPSEYTDHWLPSEFVQLTEEWQPNSDQLEVGTPVTRTITLTAVGVVEEQLPEIASSYPEQLKSYPDQADTATVQRNGTFVAQRKETVALIPNEDGSFTIPEVIVPWFNVITRKTEYASLPERVVHIKASAVTGNEVPNIVPQLDDKVTIDSPEQRQSNIQSVAQQPASTWWSMSSWVLLALWLFTLALWYFQGQKSRSSSLISKTNSESPNIKWQTMLKVIKSSSGNNIGEVQSALKDGLAAALGTSALSLNQILIEVNDKALTAEVNAMFASSYGKNSAQSWRPQRLISILEKMNPSLLKNDKNNAIQLKPLYE